MDQVCKKKIDFESEGQAAQRSALLTPFAIKLEGGELASEL